MALLCAGLQKGEAMTEESKPVGLWVCEADSPEAALSKCPWRAGVGCGSWIVEVVQVHEFEVGRYSVRAAYERVPLAATMQPTMISVNEEILRTSLQVVTDAILCDQELSDIYYEGFGDTMRGRLLREWLGRKIVDMMKHRAALRTILGLTEPQQ